MDPNAAWRELCEELNRAVTEDNIDQCVDLAEGLLGWVSKGGFVPAACEHMGRVTFGRIIAGVHSELVRTRRLFEEERKREEKRREAANKRTMAWLLM